MLLVICQVLAGILAFAAIAQALFAWVFTRHLIGAVKPYDQATKQRDRKQPPVAVVLSLRGADPDLERGLLQLFSQSYPDYHVYITVDREEDPAATAVQKAIAASGFSHVSVQPLCKRRETCSLKNSALLQMLEQVSERYPLIVQADADLVFHVDWLAELVAPLADPQVGAVFGNRWFWPEEGRLGSLVRYLWNAAAVVPMWLFRIPWGGTLAVRREIFVKTDLCEKLGKAAVDDALMRSAVESLGQQIVFAPRLIMTNREECSSKFALEFITRQMLWTRLYHPRWFPVVLHAAISTAIFLLCVVLMVAGVVTQNTPALLWLFVGAGGYQLSMAGLLALLERGIHRIAQHRNEPAYRPSFSRWMKVLVAIPVTQLIYAVAIVRCCTLQKISWRGIEYQISAPFQVDRLNDTAFTPPSDRTSNESL